MSEPKIMDSCFICGSQFQMGPHHYDGKFISSYQISVCNSCWNSNWDGWVPHYEQKLLAHLKEKNISIPKRNSKGWLPREIVS